MKPCVKSPILAITPGLEIKIRRMTTSFAGRVPLDPPEIRLNGNVEYGAIRSLVDQRLGYLTRAHNPEVLAYPHVYGPEHGSPHHPIPYHIPISKVVKLGNGAQLNIIYDPRRSIYADALKGATSCPFCGIDDSKTIAKILIDSQRYILMVNRFHWALQGILLTSDEHLGQTITNPQLEHAAIILKALGLSYNAAFQSLGSGASVDHFHVHYYVRQSENVWRFVLNGENGIKDGPICGWLAKGYLFSSSGPRRTANKIFEDMPTMMQSVAEYNILMSSYYSRISMLFFPRSKSTLEIIPGKYITFGSSLVAGYLRLDDYELYKEIEGIVDQEMVRSWFSKA